MYKIVKVLKCWGGGNRTKHNGNRNKMILSCKGAGLVLSAFAALLRQSP